jgi:hypothetical protein
MILHALASIKAIIMHQLKYVREKNCEQEVVK